MIQLMTISQSARSIRWSGSPIERGQLEEHLRECPLAMVECELKELGCENVVQRKDADKHMEQAAQTLEAT